MWNKRMQHTRNGGVTLVELIVAIVIVAVALAGAVAAFTRTDRASVDPVIVRQMATIADGLMEEILLKPFSNDAAAAPAQRIDFAKVADYNNYGKDKKGIVDVEGVAVPGLEHYGVLVEVRHPLAGELLTNVPGDDTWKIVITVRYDGVTDPFKLTGWRTKP
ncbi:prepilin-type N-terminal cleavage/methylation domain-containing protein [Massilia sp. YIM B02763]|uniref:prepilin-type N-terminal cleavage/methylation domain-containing protein n=1 Tax=Massilia sp. YIM B02763 TaxID=3050130 RepID=UPI0025B64885|nr:prepilin-type N-terminal cleavage/methylation domain-containing protein [Massilia sp. YIM B02763]MDN4051538.1 prepilin-type N-terminal cleavage/methylation domain-containing protein [Massilia sp. YIM B02763]